MSRSDLLIQLVKSGASGDTGLFRKVVEAIVADEKSKQHITYARKIQETLELNASFNKTAALLPSAKGISEFSNNLFYEKIPELNLEDLIVNRTSYGLISSFIEEQRRADILRSYGMEPRHRILLMGPPGNGKTSTAEAIASALMLPLFSVRYENIIASYLGETSVRLKNLFEYVRTQHCVVFFDEFDSIGKERGDIHETGEIKRLVSTLLLQIDNLPSYVIVIAATNHSELLDKAVWRRFQIKTTLPKPGAREIESFIDKFQKRNNFSYGLSLSTLSKKLTGFSFSEIKDFCDDIFRKYILSLPNSSQNLKKITSEALSGINKFSKL